MDISSIKPYPSWSYYSIPIGIGTESRECWNPPIEFPGDTLTEEQQNVGAWYEWDEKNQSWNLRIP